MDDGTTNSGPRSDLSAVTRSDLSAGRFGNVQWIESTGSTNSDLLALAPESPQEALVLFSDEQTKGRGRLDRSWEQASGGGLMVSFYVPWTNADSAHLVPIALGVAIVGAALGSERTVGLKWPNDIIVPALTNSDGSPSPLMGKKLGGMLSSPVIHENTFLGVVAGLGVNVSWPPLDFAELPDAAALDHLPGSVVDRDMLARNLVRIFDEELSAIQERGPESLLDRYRDRCVTLGQQVRIEQGSETVVGRATDIDPSGALILDIDGRQKRVHVGDVIHLRPA